MSEDLKPPKKMSPKEFRELGYLQELNRQFLHPLGMALEVIIDSHIDENGQTIEDVSFGKVWDYRDDPEGMTYWLDDDSGVTQQDIIEMQAKATRIEKERARMARTRMRNLGYIIQDLSIVRTRKGAQDHQRECDVPDQEG